MAKYEYRMNLIRSGQTIPLDDDSYDANADIKAHSSLLKVCRPPASSHPSSLTRATPNQSQTKEKESFLSRGEIAELRRIQAERQEIGQRRLLGLDVPRNMGVRTEEVNPMTFD